ncbi:hypothetical protein [Corallococcus carmarthensis]|nr:hypothetical protein [Corallococcus carmarthensis]RKG91719.1 hypothetical protein D7X32_44760 [Corallococcus carmarthensis]
MTLLGDGKLESVTTETLGGFLEGTRLFGRVWTEGPIVVGRYTRARMPNGEELDVCLSLSLEGDGLPKLPGSKPGAALVQANDGATFQWD